MGKSRALVAVMAAGISLAWTSPFGPLKLSLAQPLNEKKGIDRPERLQFTFGSTF